MRKAVGELQTDEISDDNLTYSLGSVGYCTVRSKEECYEAEISNCWRKVWFKTRDVPDILVLIISLINGIFYETETMYTEGY
ncbi:hypothetical protein Pcinc_010064 [Petrolisthes cinctipes]|uniref:Uncharacterized protein n=1 Tax=Petrolisthes cinctipes TaxID=88211 RepID=A0AAE1G677_PETCI|nr:hypothetical protein Pcinc_010064 [Petrolisthes cinctipes]